MPGQRALVLVSPGFLMLDQQMDEYEVMDRAIRANVTISTLNARGLYAIVPGRRRQPEHGAAWPA